MLTVTLDDDEIATLAADDSDLPIGMMTTSAPGSRCCRGGQRGDGRPPTRLRSVTGVIS